MTWISAIGLLRDQQNAVDPRPTSTSSTWMRSSRRGGQVLADVVRADRKLAVASVAEHGQLHALGPAVAEERVDRRADRAGPV
jgi:hypothetical protein